MLRPKHQKPAENISLTTEQETASALSSASESEGLIATGSSSYSGSSSKVLQTKETPINRLAYYLIVESFL